ncbi:MAG: DUF167 domain-containing protein [Chloroflexi bacterium]|jgi:uncharacterized protein|nr:DUF167 domain-containing protein [Chloroflexota bacterium]
MPNRKFHLHNGKKGAALGIRIVPRANKNEIAEIMKDGTIRVRLQAAPQQDEDINSLLAELLSSVLDVSIDQIEIIAGQSGRDKLISIVDIDATSVQKKIAASL